MRIPIPGGRAYVMVQDVGQAAGYDLNMNPGQITICMSDNVAFVHNDDWKGRLSKDWGGPDADDALWILSFVDYDGVVRMLAWRSPNQLGEYALFEPTDTESYTWQSELPHLDSRMLPEKVERNYLDIIDDETIVGKGERYTPSLVERCAPKYADNIGVLGAYCNLLMVMTAIDIMPEWLPAPLEHVIDSTVKTGASLKQVNKWIEKKRDAIINGAFEIPRAVASRLSKFDSVPLTTDHWMDQLVARIRKSIQNFNLKVQCMAANCNPPEAVLQLGMAGAENGEKLRRAYNAVIASAIRSKGEPDETDHKLALIASAEILHPLDNQQRAEALAYILTSGVAEQRSDAAAWQRSLTAPMTLDVLRDFGLINSYDENCKPYIKATQDLTAGTVPVQINGVWMQMIRAVSPKFTGGMSDVPEDLRTQWKQAVASAKWNGKQLEIRAVHDRLTAYINDKLVGYVAKNQRPPTGRYVILTAKADDGNLTTFLQAA